MPSSDSKAAKGRILCVEYHPDTRDLITYSLNRAGFEIVCAGSASEAFSLVLTEHFDLYVIDNWLPEISGVELCRRIRRRDPTTPILFYSAAAFDADRKRAFEAGATAYLVKPVSDDLLVREAIRLINECPSKNQNATTSQTPTPLSEMP